MKSALGQKQTCAAHKPMSGPDLTAPPQVSYYEAFRSQLEKHGFREGQNIVVEHRADDDPRGPFVGAAELMHTQPDLIVAVALRWPCRRS